MSSPSVKTIPYYSIYTTLIALLALGKGVFEAVSAYRDDAADVVGKLLSEFQAPMANRLVVDLDSSRCKQILYIAETQTESEVELGCMGNDLDRESVPPIN